MSVPNNLKLWIVDCLAGGRAAVGGSPFTIGSNSTSDFMVQVEPTDAVLARVVKVCDSYHIQPGELGESLLFDGKTVKSAELSARGIHTLVIRGYPFTLCLAGEEGKTWSDGVDPSKWFVYSV